MGTIPESYIISSISIITDTPNPGGPGGSGNQAGPIAGIVIGVIGGCLLISGVAVFLVKSGRVPSSLPGLSRGAPAAPSNASDPDGGFSNVAYSTKDGQTSLGKNANTSPGQLYADLGDAQPGRNAYMNASDA